MDRRKFLGGAALTGLALATPEWIARAFAQDLPPVAGVGVLSAAYRRAARLGKPLLVWIIPSDNGAKWARGSAFGELVNHGGDGVMRDLALAEVVCATMADLRTLVPSVPRSGEPLMVLVETDRLPATVRVLDTTLAPYPDWPFADGTSWEERQRREDAAVDARIHRLGDLVHAALGPTRDQLSRRERLARARLDARTIERIDRAIATGQVAADLSLADRAAALVAYTAAVCADPAFRASLHAALAGAATARLQRSRVPGSRWAHHSGCATTIEDEPEHEMVAVACGMGHVPARSERFLYFFTRWVM